MKIGPKNGYRLAHLKREGATIVGGHVRLLLLVVLHGPETVCDSGRATVCVAAYSM